MFAHVVTVLQNVETVYQIFAKYAKHWSTFADICKQMLNVDCLKFDQILKYQQIQTQTDTVIE